MNARLAILLAVAAVAAGCGTLRRGSSPEASGRRESTTRDQTSGREGTRPAGRTYGHTNNSGRTATDGRIATPGVTRPVVTFSGLETEHVKLFNQDPVPVEGYTWQLSDLAQEFCYPYFGALISDYGMRGQSMHTGIDIKCIPGDTIRAAMPGVVRMSKNYSSYGNTVVIRHYNGLETVYSHGLKNLVEPNDPVEAGTPIALAGRTGRATTEHLHFEVRVAGQCIDPKYLVDPNAMDIRSGVLYVGGYGNVIVATNDGAALAESIAEAQAGVAAHNDSRAAAVAASTVNGQPKGPAEPEPVYYRVRSGDTLSRIAVNNGTTVKKLCELNNIKSTTLLQINRRLRVK